jgi:hypothetical protein
LTSTQKTKLMSYVNTTFKEPRTIFANHYIVTVSGGSYWLALFPSAVPSKTPTITFTAGNTYIFDQSHVSNIGKPIVLTRPDGSVYTTGVTTVGTIGQSVNAYTQVIIPSTGFTDTLAYFVLTPTETVNAIRFKSRNTPATTSQYGRLTAMSGDGNVYAFTSGPSSNQEFNIFSVATNSRLGSVISTTTITALSTNQQTQLIKLNYDGSLLFTSSTYPSPRSGRFQAYSFNGTAWSLKGAISGPNTSGGLDLGGIFATSDDGNIVHIAYNWNNTGETPKIESYTFASNAYTYRSNVIYNNTQTSFARIFSGTKDGTRLAIPFKENGARFIVYDWNPSSYAYTQVGSTILVTTTTDVLLHANISSDGTTVILHNQEADNGGYYIYTFVNNDWSKIYATSATPITNINPLPKINKDGSLLAITSNGTTKNKIFYYIKNNTTYNYLRTIDLSHNIVNYDSTSFSENLYSFAVGREDFNSSKGCIDLYNYN